MAYIGTKPANQITDSTLIADGTVTPADLSTGRPVWDTNGNVGIGTSSPASRLAILENTNGNSILNVRNTNAGSSATSILALGNDGALNGAYLVLNSSTNTSGGAGNSLNITNGFNAPMTFGTNGTERMRITSAGVLELSQGQIRFPATQSSSADANTLDDYEEGTFTPSIIGSSTAGTATYAQRNARYTKIGRLVQYEIYLSWSLGNGSGSLILSGLPFTCASGSTFPAVTISFPNNLTLPANSVATAYVISGGTNMDFYAFPIGGGAAQVIAYDASAEILLSGTYSV